MIGTLFINVDTKVRVVCFIFMTMVLNNNQGGNSEDLRIFDPLEPWKETTLKGGTYELREIMVPVFLKGKCVYESPEVMDIRSYCMEEQNTLWEESRRLINPHEMYVDLSDRLYTIKKQLINDYSMKKRK